jgi:RibD C-terminal domain
VPSHRPPGPSVANYPLVTYVTDGIVSAMAQAKAAAGDRDVLVHGAYTAQRALEAGVLDELQIHQVPVLFGGGRRLFELLPSRVELKIVRVIDTPETRRRPPTFATASVAEPRTDAELLADGSVAGLSECAGMSLEGPSDPSLPRKVTKRRLQPARERSP